MIKLKIKLLKHRIEKPYFDIILLVFGLTYSAKHLNIPVEIGHRLTKK